MSQRPIFSYLLWKLVFRPLPGLFLLFMGVSGGVFGQDFTASYNSISGTCTSPNQLKITIQGVPGNYQIVVTGPSPSSFTMTIPANATTVSQTLTALIPGAYNVGVSDASGLRTVLPIVTNIPGPSNAYLNATTDASCLDNDGVVDIIVLGGTAPYTFMYNGANVGMATSAGSVGEATGLPSGTLQLTIVDANGCTLPETEYVPIDNNLSLLMDNSSTICKGTSKPITVNSNATSFSWSPATGLSSATVEDPIAAPDVTTTYTVTAKLGVCPPTQAYITIAVLPAPVASAESPDTTCYGKDIYLQASGGIQYMWEPTTYLNNPTIADPLVINPKSSIVYSVNVTDVNGCTSLKPATVDLHVDAPYQVFAGDDTSVMVGQTVNLNAVDVQGVGFNKFVWIPGVGLNNPLVADPTASFAEVGTYTYVVDATAPNGCGGSDSVTIKVFSMADLFVPNAFTPNGDGHNDVLRAIPVSIREFKYLTIFNRWGQRVFTTTNVGIGWDGTFNGGQAPTGTYVWMVGGVDYSGRVVEKKGTVMLIR